MAKVFFGIRTLCRQIPAGKAVIGGRHRVPALAGGFFQMGSDGRSWQSVTLARGGFAVGQGGARRGLKVKRPVFFTAQVRAPGCFAVAAIVQRAPAHGARGVPAGHHFLPNVFDGSPGATDAHRCLWGDAAVQSRAGIDAPACWCFVDLDHRDAVQVDLFEHFQFRPVAQVPFAKLRKLLATHPLRGLSVGMQKVGVCRAFVVDTQNSAGGFFFRILALGIDVKNIHAIVVITNAARPIIFFKTAVRVSRCAGVHGVAGGVQNAVLVARRQDHVVEQTFRDGREAQSCGGRAQARGQGGTTRQDGQARQSQATQQHVASLGVGQRCR